MFRDLATLRRGVATLSCGAESNSQILFASAELDQRSRGIGTPNGDCIPHGRSRSAPVGLPPSASSNFAPLSQARDLLVLL